MDMNKYYLIAGCAGLAGLAALCGAGQARTLETGRAAGYYTHSGAGARSAEARFKRFKERSVSPTISIPITVVGEGGNRYEMEVEDREAKARVLAKVWEKRQGAKARTVVNQAEQETQSRIAAREMEVQALNGSLRKLKLAVQAKKVDDVLAGKLVETLSRRVRRGTMDRMQAAEAIKYLIANNKVNIVMD